MKGIHVSHSIAIQPISFLVGGFNPFEKYESKWEASPTRGEHKKSLKPPPRFLFNLLLANCRVFLNPYLSCVGIPGSTNKRNYQSSSGSPELNTACDPTKIWLNYFTNWNKGISLTNPPFGVKTRVFGRYNSPRNI